ncbi:MAG: hypothetical protein ACAH83_14585 [Alphaproteobacteria bacterium]
MAAAGQEEQKGTTQPAASSTFLGPKPAPARPKQEEDPAEKKRRADIRKVLIQQARDNYAALAPTADTRYAQQLQALETGVSDYLSRYKYEAYDGRQPIVLNPDQFGVGRALGMDARATVRKMLEQRGVDAPKDAVSDLAAHMSSTYESKFGFFGSTQNAEVRDFDAGSGKKYHVMVPSSGSIGPNRVPGMPYSDNIEFINRHEAWHMKDAWYDLSKFPKDTQDTAAVGFSAPYLSADYDTREAYSMITRKEALSDIAAVGDMMRERHVNSYKMLNQVTAWREASPGDDAHITTPVLNGFKKEIERIGFGKFMKMSEADAQEFYHGVVEKYGMNEQSVKYAADYENASKDERRKLLADAGSDPEMKKALEFLKYRNAEPTNPDAAMTNSDEKTQQTLDAYNPYKQLLDKAFEKGNKITPETLIRAHRDMADDLLAKADDEDARRKNLGQSPNPLYRLELAKLQRVFNDTVQYSDYVELNKQRGVTIEEVEPGLQQLTKPAAGSDPSQASVPARKGGKTPSLS